MNDWLERRKKLPPTEYLDLPINQTDYKRARQESGSDVRWVREFAAEGTHTSAEWKALRQQYDNVCVRCREKRPLVKDHVIPLEKGGTNYISNIQPLCKNCNSSKGTKQTDYRKSYRRR